MKLRSWFLLPARVWMALFFAAPLAIIGAYSFLTRGDYGGVEYPWTIESYARLADPLYLAILWRSLWIAGLSTAICVAMGFPLALFISRAGKRKNLYLQLVLLPFWTSFLVRTYAWLFILRDTGLINTILSALHIIKSPLPLLYNDGAVLLGLVYSFLPFFVLPMYATLERLDPALLEAAADLGCRKLRAFLAVTLPLSLPGIAAGCLLVFIPAVGEFVIPDLLGGPDTLMIGKVLWDEFFINRDWPVASAVAIAMLVLLVAPIALAQRALGRGGEAA